ncbi:MAG: hypothetical protein AAB421_03590 [Patescibacteria group bacterium]
MEGASSLQWEGYEHHHVERGRDWYWALGIISVSCALTSLLFGNILFGLLILVAAVTLGLTALHPPPLVQFELGEHDLRIADTVYPYKEMIAFWVKDGPEPSLLIDTLRFMAPDLILPIADIDPDSLREFLKEKVAEKQLEEPFAHRFLEFFGF